MRLTIERVAQAAADAGWTRTEDVAIATAIAVAESGLDPRAHNPVPPDNSYGLWQINMLGAMGPERRKWFGIATNEELFDPDVNARAARKVFLAQTWTAWSVYKNGAFSKYMAVARAAAQQVVKGEGMQIIPRGTWGARHDDGSGNRRLPATEAWLHHSVTVAPDLIPPFDDEYRAMQALERIGEQRFGRGISYTFCIMPNGRVYQGHSVGRIGAHTGGHNTPAIGICLVGNYQTTPLSDLLVRTIADLLRHCAQQGWLARPQLNGGHRDVKSTGCPGDLAYRRIPDINRLALNPLPPKPPEVHPVTGVARVDLKWTSPQGYLVLFADGGFANYGDAPSAKELSCFGAQPYPEVKATSFDIHPSGRGVAVLWDNGNIDTRNAPHLGEPLLKK